MPQNSHDILTNPEQRVQGSNTLEDRIDLTQVDWEDLRRFRVVARHGSLRAAASQEGCAVNTLRLHMDRLEVKLARPLLRRSTKGITLTETGHVLNAAIADMSEAAFRLHSSSRDVLVHPGQITIACSEGLGTLWLTPRILELEASLPDLTIGLLYDYNLARDRAREADIWLTFERPERQDLIVSKLATLHFHPFAAERYIQRHGTPACIDDLKQHSIVEHVGPGVRSELLDYLIGSSRSPGKVVLRSNSSLAQLWAVAQGAGIGCLPTFVREITRAVVPLPTTINIRRELWLVYQETARSSPAIQSTVGWLRFAFASNRYPCFSENFLHPADFSSKSKDGKVVELFPGMFDRMD